MSRLDFRKINAAALEVLPALVARWLPGGERRGDEWYALNPHRPDRHRGSFKINLRTGKWADFAIPKARGRDVISLAAYLTGKSYVDAARALANMLGVG